MQHFCLYIEFSDRCLAMNCKFQQIICAYATIERFLRLIEMASRFSIESSIQFNEFSRKQSWAWILIGHLWTFKWLRRSNGEELKICIAVRTKIKSFHWFSLVIVSLRLGFSLSLILSLEINSYVYGLLWIFSRFLLKQFQIQWS